MQSENKTCQNCKKDFTIEPDDFSFYEKIQVPPPTFCPECRMQRRMAFMNIYSVYKRPCDKCGEQTISMFHKAKEYTVYCSKCWWADDWDGSEYAMEYDPQKSIFEQIDELHKRTPHMSLDTLHSSLVDTHYTNYSSHLKRCYGLFFADYAENCMYAEFVNGMTDTMDCLRVKDCELCYGSVGIHKCSRVFYSEECDSCVEVYFSKNCSGCTNCFGCMNLRNKSYCVYNQQYTKEQYEQFMLEANIHSGDSLDVHSMQAREFWLTLPVRAYHGNSLNVSVSGDYVYESKNTHDAYLVSGAEDSKYVQLLSVPFTRDAYDYTCWGGNSEKIYETLVAGHGANTILFSIGAYPDAMNQEYCFYASACKNSFGCVNLKRKKYSILNKEYSKEAYERLRETIIVDMKQHPYIDPRGNTYTYGEFFPPNLSPFGYNETAAYEYFPLSESEAKRAGYSLFDGEKNEYVPTIASKDLPDTFSGDYAVTNEIVQCSYCDLFYRFTDVEIDLLRKLAMPLPKKCPHCRRKDRFERVNKPHLYERVCARCNSPVQTSYASDRPEIIYCESCYQKEVM